MPSQLSLQQYMALSPAQQQAYSNGLDWTDPSLVQPAYVWTPPGGDYSAYAPAPINIAAPNVQYSNVDLGGMHTNLPTLDSALRMWASSLSGLTLPELAAQGISSQSDLIAELNAQATQYCAESLGAGPGCGSGQAGVVASVSQLFQGINWQPPVYHPPVAQNMGTVQSVATQPQASGSGTPTNFSARINPAQPGRVNPTIPGDVAADTHSGPPGAIHGVQIVANDPSVPTAATTAPVTNAPSQQTMFNAANMVTASALTGWMQAAIGSPVASVDQWCYGMNELIVGGFQCPGPELFGFVGAQRFSPVTADVFLTQLRAYYATQTASGGVSTTGGSPAPSGTSNGQTGASTGQPGGMLGGNTGMLLFVAAAVVLFMVLK
jgi:hypothetical protein